MSDGEPAAIVLDGSTLSGGVLVIGDHASNRMPAGMDLGIDAELLATHIALDIGVAGVAQALNREFGFAAVLANVSRLVVDLNRGVDESAVIPETSDGVDIPANRLDEAGRAARLDDYYWPYHHGVAARIAAVKPDFLLFLHSFTPALQSAPGDARPWHVGVMYDRDRRAADLAMPLLAGAGFVAGDQLPYSGQVYNSSLGRHGEANGIGYIGLEMRQDLVADARLQREMAQKLGPICQNIAETLAPAR